MQIAIRIKAYRPEIRVFCLVILGLGISFPGSKPAAAEFFQLDHFLSQLLRVDADYTATRKVFVDETTFLASSITYSHGRERQDIHEQDAGIVVLGITLPEEDIIYLKTTFSQMPELDQESWTPLANLPKANHIDRIAKGSETVNGYQATRYEVSATLNNGAKVSGSIWLRSDAIPVKAALQVALEELLLPYNMEQTQIQVAPQAPERFVFPSQ